MLFRSRHTAPGVRGAHWSVAILLPLLVCCARTTPIDYSGATGGWSSWGGDAGGMRYSPVTQITPANVRQLKVAWIYRIGEPNLLPAHPTPAAQVTQMLAKGLTPEVHRMPALEATPILADGRLYLCSSSNRVVALDPQTGHELWSFDPKLDATGAVLLLCRGVSYYHDAQAAAQSACASRIFTGTQDARLIALDAKDGKPCAVFGNAGSVDLKAGLGPTLPGDYGVTAPPAIVGDRVVVGGRLTEDMRTDMPAGVVRAFDARSGALLWAWNSVAPQAQGTTAEGSYRRSTANTWSVFSVDPQRNLVFIPTGNAQVGLYGTTRDTDGRDYYASSVGALDAATGNVVWHFQTVHHDLWDYDVPSQPVLFDFPTAAGPVPAVAQPTKQGYLFILNRETGEPLVPVAERAAPQGGAAPGEHLAATQPVPTDATYVLQRPRLTEADMWGFTFWDRDQCRKTFRKYRYEGAFSAPSLQGTITYPDNLGVMNWGSAAIDPARNLLIINTSHVATIAQLVPRDEADARFARGEWLLAQEGTPYAASWKAMLSPWGAPCNKPPWGELVAIDLKNGRRLWQVPLGSTRDLAPWPLWLTIGTPNIGGPLVTASGLTFIGAATDDFLRAFDNRSGAELWKGRLPAGPQATPMTYRLGPQGKQFVVIAAGGHKYMRTKLGDYLVAFSL